MYLIYTLFQEQIDNRLVVTLLGFQIDDDLVMFLLSRLHHQEKIH
jgi:hypothetical protein